MREFDQKASDAAWLGDSAEAQSFTEQANSIRIRIEAGELYEVDF